MVSLKTSFSSFSEQLDQSIDTVLDKSRASKAGPSFVVDTIALQRKVDRLKQMPVRSFPSFFRAPKDASQAVKEGMAKQAIGRWIRWQEQEGWHLASNVEIGLPKQATDANGNIPLLGVQEHPMRATFQYRGKAPKPLRIQFPKDGVKQSPDHRLSLREAMRVWDVSTKGLPPP